MGCMTWNSSPAASPNVVCHFMRLQNICIILVAICLNIGCMCNANHKSGTVEYKEVTFVDIVDDVPLPPEHLTSKFKTLQEWLYSICDGELPTKLIVSFNLGLFESPENNVIFLVGINKDKKGDTTYTRIEFEPINMYFQLPDTEYKNLNRNQLLSKLIVQLKTFADTEKFKASFLSKANDIVFEPNGQIIWSSNTDPKK